MLFEYFDFCECSSNATVRGNNTFPRKAERITRKMAVV
jgi:hypothetical protein